MQDAYEPVCSPHAVARNEFEDPVYIHVDNEACLQANDMLDAFLILVPVYFVLWLSYPRKANASYQYLQQELLGINDRKVPSKLACILERLND